MKPIIHSLMNSINLHALCIIAFVTIAAGQTTLTADAGGDGKAKDGQPHSMSLKDTGSGVWSEVDWWFDGCDAAQAPDIYTQGLGWVNSTSTNAVSMTFWSNGILGWFWTSHAVYPWLWSYDVNGWFYYYDGSGNGSGAWLYNFNRGENQWLSATGDNGGSGGSDTPTPGNDFTIDLGDGAMLEMVWIAPGKFSMGSPYDEPERLDREGPPHLVTLTQGFWMGKYEVTQAQYLAIAGENPSYFKAVGPTAPVEQVNWNDAMEYCDDLTMHQQTAGRLPSGYAYALPTEAQWEYACRADTNTAYSSGAITDALCSEPNLNPSAWYCGNSGSTTHPVGQQLPNGWGLYDMHGNVYEWCFDWFGSYDSIDVVDPMGADTGHYRVCRGGAYNSHAKDCRSAYRNITYPGIMSNNLGFRLTLSPIQ